MNTILKKPAVVFLMCALLAVCCTNKSGDTHEHAHESEVADGEWHEMDVFHMIMAETFHPYKDSANLEPAKSRARELLQVADEWSKTALPSKVDNDQVRAKLQQLKSEAAMLLESVKSSDDNVIGERLTRVHDTFHAIQDEWYKRD